MKIKPIIAMAIAISLLASSAVGVTAQSEEGTLVVAQDGSGDFATITEAVKAAEDGGTILVRPGTYIEAIVIDKDITLTGDGPREGIIIEAPEDGPTSNTGQVGLGGGSMDAPYAVLLVDSDATLSGLTFRGERSQVHANGGAPLLEDLALDSVGRVFRGAFVGGGIIVTGGTLATIRGNTLFDGGSIVISDHSEPLIDGNVLSGGPHIVGNPGEGAVIRGNTISGTWAHGIGILGPTTALIEANTIMDLPGSGIIVGFGTGEGIDPMIKGNSISRVTTGINVAAGARPTIEGNEITGSGTAMLITRSDLLVAGNDIHDNAGGITLVGGSPTLVDNTITGNKTGLALSGSDTSPVLSGNTICDNETNLIVVLGAEMPDTEGNDICPDAPAEVSE